MGKLLAKDKGKEVNKYYFILTDKINGKVLDAKVYNLKQNQQELNETIKKSNESTYSKVYHKQVFTKEFTELIELYEENKPKKDIDDLFDMAEGISNDVYTLIKEIEILKNEWKER